MPPGRERISLGEVRQPVVVEMVRRLIEQDDIEAGHREPGETGPRELPAGERQGRAVEQVLAEAELGGGGGQPGVEVGAAEGQPPVERGRVGVDRGEVAVGESCRHGDRARARRPPRRHARESAHAP